MDCDKVRAQLGACVDGELPAGARIALKEHVATCPDCAAELESIEALAARLVHRAPPSVPAAIWTSIEQRLESASRQGPSRSTLWTKLRIRFKPLAMAAGILLVVGLGLLGIFRLDSGTARVEASTIDFSSLLDSLPLDAPKAFRKFLIQYEAKESTAQRARQDAPNLNFAIPESLPGGFQLKGVHTLRFGEHVGVAAEYSRDDEFLGALFHSPVRQEDYGTHKDYSCAVGKHRGHTVEVGPWRMVHLTDPTTCHCILSKLDLETELPAIMAAVAPALPSSGAVDHHH